MWSQRSRPKSIFDRMKTRAPTRVHHGLALESLESRRLLAVVQFSERQALSYHESEWRSTATFDLDDDPFLNLEYKSSGSEHDRLQVLRRDVGRHQGSCARWNDSG